jgi:hypothetical protein
MFQSALSRMIQISDIGVSYVYWILVFVLRILFFISVGSPELAIDPWHYRMQKNGSCVLLYVPIHGILSSLTTNTAQVQRLRSVELTAKLIRRGRISLEGTEENNDNGQVEIRKENISSSSQDRYKFSQPVLYICSSPLWG